MRAAIIPLLVLLFSMCGAQTQSTQTEVQTEIQSTGAAAAAEVTTQLDVSTELKELRDLVTQQGEQLEFQRQQHLSLLTSFMQFNAQHNADLRFLDLTLDRLKGATAAQETRLAATETDVVNLQKAIATQPKIAFSVGLGKTNAEFIESGNKDLKLVFPEVFTNVGQAYSSTTGYFTAPVKGVYFFRFTVMDLLESFGVFIQLCKNGQFFIYLSGNDTGKINYLSSGVILELEEGDVINLVLPAYSRIFDSIEKHNIFSGFLLFPV